MSATWCSVPMFTWFLIIGTSSLLYGLINHHFSIPMYVFVFQYRVRHADIYAVLSYSFIYLYLLIVPFIKIYSETFKILYLLEIFYSMSLRTSFWLSLFILGPLPLTPVLYFPSCNCAVELGITPASSV